MVLRDVTRKHFVTRTVAIQHLELRYVQAMHPSSSFLGDDKDASLAAFPIEELIEKSDGFVGFFAFTDSLTSINAMMIIPGKK
ncbi:hypothetical protein Tco_0173502 [Tanacetum coccineum]